MVNLYNVGFWGYKIFNELGPPGTTTFAVTPVPRNSPAWLTDIASKSDLEGP